MAITKKVKQNFAHLHCHDEYSLLDGFGTPDAYAARASELGFEYLAITNHGNIDGLIKFQGACEENKITPIFGVELYIVKNITKKEKGEKKRHICIFVKNKIGWENLLKMLTIANLEGFYYKPRIDSELLWKYKEGLIISTACTSSFIVEDWGFALFKDLITTMPDDLFLEIMPHELEEQKELNKLCYDLSKEYGIPLIATNDCHYIKKDQNVSQEVLLAIQSKAKWDDKKRWRFTIDGLYLKTEKEMIQAFKEQDSLNYKVYKKAMNNTIILAEKCKDFKIEKLPIELPAVFKGKDDEEELKRLCNEGYEKKIINKNKDSDIYKERLKEELEIIIRQGFSRYFLIVWELVHWCKENDIMVGPGRGSSGGSLVAYLLSITAIDPIEYKLIFARFISPARIDLPDIDIDFEDIKRPLIRKHLEDVYGKWSVCGVSTFSSMKGKGAIRDVSRVFNVPLTDVNKASSSIVTRSGGDFRSDYTITDAFDTFEDGIEFKKKYPLVTKIAIDIEGQVRGKGQHAAAIVISSDDLRNGRRMCYVHGKNKNELLANWDKHDIEHQGLMKLDVLGLNALTVLNETKKLVKENHNYDINFEELPLDDKRIFEEFSKGNNAGCFQFGSLGLRKLCQELIIDDFGTLVHANSLYRPGTLRSGMTNEFVARKRGESEWEYKHPILEELTKDTYGIILYQEQVMKFMYDLGGLGWRTADSVRKVISKSKGVEQFQKFKKDFVEGCKKRKTLDEKTASELWDELSSFGSYGFNLSHACEYSMIAYWDMYCKIYYPNEFLCASLTYLTSEDKKEELIDEAIRLDVDVRPPKIDKSDPFKWVLKDGVLYAPFIEIKGVGEKTAEQFKHIGCNNDGFYKKKDVKIQKRFLNILEEIKAFDDTPTDDDFADSIRHLFNFSLCRDKTRKFKNIMKIFQKDIKIKKISSIDHSKSNEDFYYYFGRMTEIKFGYKKAVGKSSKSLNMGGVYGNLQDDSDYVMIIFNSEIYDKKKDLIEHCGDKFILAKANHPAKNTNIICNDAWTEEEIFSGELKGLKLNAARKKRFSNEEIKDCEDCELRKECSSPVLPSKGLYNIMIVGEAPGKDEDKEGRGFIGRAGKLLWDEIEDQGYRRKQFHVTNTVKCYPSKTKTPDKKHIKKCSKWLDEEIKNIKPFLILSFGNTGLKYFKEEASGIMSKNGTTEWIEEIGAWVCWCIHPASVLYHRENMQLFKEGIENFINKVKIIGGI